MSNPTSVVTERRLGAFYQEILPYLGGSADAGFTPVGSVIAIMGVTAPANYLACNGQIVNVADYPELANYFQQQFGTKYKFGGSGTTFGIPDLRGEFLRGTGTNSHTNQGNGSAVGTHQDATVLPYEYVNSSGVNAFRGRLDTNGSILGEKFDNIYRDESHYQATDTGNAPSSTFSGSSAITTRPTNTSILWCIATKDIYLNPALDYSTSEKVVGKWIDGKTLYQKTFALTVPTYVEGSSEATGERIDYNTNIELTSIDNIFIDRCNYSCFENNAFSNGYGGTLDISVNSSGTVNGLCRTWIGHNGTYIRISIRNKMTTLNGQQAYVTLHYTKTT